MMWLNKATGELQSAPPWGRNYLRSDVIAARFANWEEVSSSYKPEQTLTQKVAEVQAPHLAQIAQLRQAMVVLSAMGKATAEVQARYVQTLAEMKAAIQAVIDTE